MEFRVLSKGGTPHLITTTPDDEGISLTVTRVEQNGGVPKSVKRRMPLDTGYTAMVTSITKLIELDNELYNLVCETMKDKESKDGTEV